MFGGLGLFIYGIHAMSSGMQKVAGDRLRSIIAKFTSNRFMGVLVGAGTTSVIQSSSITTVTVVGFINAGLMTLTQGIGVIMGANIGTTITAQLIAFRLTDYALPIVGLGSLLFVLGRSKRQRDLGEAVFGFGILFLGLSIMTGVTKPLGGTPMVHTLFASLQGSPLLALLAGLLVTMMVQSSSVTVGLTIALAAAGLLDLRTSIFIIFGDNIGTCITALIASVGTNLSAKRAALAHVMFNVLGVCMAFILLPVYYSVVTSFSGDIARQIANTHTLFNVVNTMIFLPFVPFFAAMLKRVLPGEDVADVMKPRHLDRHLLSTPTVAIEAARKELVHMTSMVRSMFDQTMESFFDGGDSLMKKVVKTEVGVDSLQDAVTHYLVDLTQEELSVQQSERIPRLLHSVNDLERIGDHAVNLMELVEDKNTSRCVFSDKAREELRRLQTVLSEMFDDTVLTLGEDDIQAARRVLVNEEEVNALTLKFRDNHVKRLECRECNINAGVIYTDILMNLEKIGDHLSNIAQATLGSLGIRT